jgi:hypothetical protein
MIYLTSFLLALLQLVGGQDFSCGTYEEATELTLEPFDAIAPQVDCAGSATFIVPKLIHWHIYAIDDEYTPRYSMFPEGILEPFVRDGVLRMGWADSLDGVSEGNSTKAAVNLFIPATQMRKITTNGIGEVVQITNVNASAAPEVLTIEDNGIGNKFYVRSSGSPVRYAAGSTDAAIEAEVMAGSSFQFSSLNQKARIKNLGVAMDVIMDGVNQEVTIEGGYTNLALKGANAKVFINYLYGCDNVENSGASSKCTEVTRTVNVADLECLSSTEAITFVCASSAFSPYSSAAAVLGSVLSIWFSVW